MCRYPVGDGANRTRSIGRRVAERRAGIHWRQSQRTSASTSACSRKSSSERSASIRVGTGRACEFAGAGAKGDDAESALDALDLVHRSGPLALEASGLGALGRDRGAIDATELARAVAANRVELPCAFDERGDLRAHGLKGLVAPSGAESASCREANAPHRAPRQASSPHEGGPGEAHEADHEHEGAEGAGALGRAVPTRTRPAARRLPRASKSSLAVCKRSCRKLREPRDEARRRRAHGSARGCRLARRRGGRRRRSRGPSRRREGARGEVEEMGRVRRDVPSSAAVTVPLSVKRAPGSIASPVTRSRGTRIVNGGAMRSPIRGTRIPSRGASRREARQALRLCRAPPTASARRSRPARVFP